MVSLDADAQLKRLEGIDKERLTALVQAAVDMVSGRVKDRLMMPSQLMILLFQ